MRSQTDLIGEHKRLLGDIEIISKQFKNEDINASFQSMDKFDGIESNSSMFDVTNLVMHFIASVTEYQQTIFELIDRKNEMLDLMKGIYMKFNLLYRSVFVIKYLL